MVRFEGIIQGVKVRRGPLQTRLLFSSRSSSSLCVLLYCFMFCVQELTAPQLPDGGPPGSGGGRKGAGGGVLSRDMVPGNSRRISLHSSVYPSSLPFCPHPPCINPLLCLFTRALPASTLLLSFCTGCFNYRDALGPTREDAGDGSCHPALVPSI